MENAPAVLPVFSGVVELHAAATVQRLKNLADRHAVWSIAHEKNLPHDVFIVLHGRGTFVAHPAQSD